MARCIYVNEEVVVAKRSLHIDVFLIILYQTMRSYVPLARSRIQNKLINSHKRA